MQTNKTKKAKKRRYVRNNSSSSTECSDEKMSLASSTEDLILACEQVDISENENSEDDLQLANLYVADRQSCSNGNQLVYDQLILLKLPDSSLQSCGGGGKPVDD